MWFGKNSNTTSKNSIFDCLQMNIMPLSMASCELSLTHWQ